jgi:ribosomal-protein-alanine N-acetyltransferase
MDEPPFMKTHIRIYTTADKEGCLAAFKSNVPLYFTQAEIAEFDHFLDTFMLKPEGQRTRFFVLVANNIIVGCGGFGDKDNTGNITLAWGLVHKDYHKTGLGELLLTHRLEQIKLLYPSKPVGVDTTQFSAGFFERFGFKTTKITPDFYEKGMHRHDMIYEYHSN